MELNKTDESSNPPTLNSDFSPTAKDSSQRENLPYICGLRARIECEHEANIQPAAIESQI